MDISKKNISKNDIWRRLMKIVQGLKYYFSDKRNRIVHATVGISAMIATLFNVIGMYDRLALFAVAVGFNVLRMRYMA